MRISTQCGALCLAAWASTAYAGDGFLSQRRQDSVDEVASDVEEATRGLFDSSRWFGNKTDKETRFGGKWSHVSPLAYSARKCTQAVDFIQIVDSELNQDEVQWSYSKKMAQLMVDTFTLGEDDTNMGLLNFGGETVQVLELSDPAGQDNTKAKSTIMQLKQLAGDSYLDDAAMAAAQLFANARGVPQVLSIISDFATPVDLTALRATMDALHDNPNFVSVAVVMGDAWVNNATAGEMIAAITGCTDLTDGLCASLIKADFTYPSIMLAAAEAKSLVCAALDTAAEISDLM